MAAKKTAAKKPAARQTHKNPPSRTAKTCAYIDGDKAVASRQTPRGTPQYLCEVHAAQIARLGVTVERL